MKSLPRYPAAWRIKFNPTRKAMSLASLVSKPVKSIYNRLFPIGYEDEKGFHYEAQRRQTREKPPGQRGSAGNQL
jgi:hypothetical protein